MTGELAGRGVTGPGQGAASMRWIDAARWAAVAAACTVTVSPPLENAAIVEMPLCLLASAQAMARLRHSMMQPLAVRAATIVAAIALGMRWSSVPWIDRLKAFCNWRKL
jgi:hypothetical protein